MNKQIIRTFYKEDLQEFFIDWPIENTYQDVCNKTKEIWKYFDEYKNKKFYSIKVIQPFTTINKIKKYEENLILIAVYSKLIKSNEQLKLKLNEQN